MLGRVNGAPGSVAGTNERYGVPADQLMPWHYGNPYFQDLPPGLYELDLDPLFAGRDQTARECLEQALAQRGRSQVEPPILSWFEGGFLDD